MDNIGIVYDIFSDSTWENIYRFKADINKITDQKLKVGLLAEFIRPGFDYVDKDIAYDILDSINVDDIDIFDASDYYITEVNNDCRTILNMFLEEDIQIDLNLKLIEWVKSLSNQNMNILETYCVKNENYEIIGFLLELRK